MRKLMLTIFLLSFFFLIREAKAVLYISDCWNLDQPVEYILTQDIIDHAGTCMNITVDYVTLNCNNHKIDGVGTTNYYGIYLLYSYPRGVMHTTIKNCVITDWYAGIRVPYNTQYWHFINNTFMNLNYSILSSGANGYCEISNSSFKNVSSAFYIDTLERVFLSNFFNNIITDSDFGFQIQGTNNIVYNNTFKNIKGIAILLREETGSAYNWIFKNFFNVSNRSLVWWSGNEKAYLNDTEKGNYWGKTDGTGFSDICSDLDQNGICDDKYILWAYGIDYLPISRYGLPPPPPTPPIPTCGNGICDIGENYYNCPQDCKTPPSAPVPTTSCMVCNYRLLNPRDFIQNFYIGLCLIANLIVCNGLYLVIFVLFMLFLYFLKEWRKKELW
jgi:hypothetical protein